MMVYSCENDSKSDVALAMHHRLIYSTPNNMRKIKQYVKYALEQLLCWMYTVSCNCLCTQLLTVLREGDDRTVGCFTLLC